MMIVSLIVVAIISFVGGGFIIGFLRQKEIQALSMDLELAREREMRLQRALSDLKHSLGGVRQLFNSSAR